MPDDSPLGTEEGRVGAATHPVPGLKAGDLSAAEATLLAELAALGTTVACAKQEIARLRMGDITERHIPAATDELDAIVEHTAHATNEILDCCEALERLPSCIGQDEAQELQRVITRIYEACSFQDITGQRIGKVVAALKAIEARVAAITGRYMDGRETTTADQPPTAHPPTTHPAEGTRLATGPQLPGAGNSQADIDRLLSDF